MKMTRVVPMLNQVRELSSAITRGVARIFSEVRKILQTAPYPSLPPPPPNQKSNYVVSLRVFFCIHQMTLATCKILCRVFGSIDWCTSIIYHTIRLQTFPDSSIRNPDNFVTGFVLSFLSRCSAWIRIERCRFGQASIDFESEI